MSVAGLRPEDVITAAGFIAVVLAAMGWDAVRHARDNSPRARMRRRAIEMTEGNRPVVLLTGDSQSQGKPTGQITLLFRQINQRVLEKGGPSGLWWMSMAGLAGVLIPAVLILLAQESPWLILPAAPLGAAVAGWGCLRYMTNRFRRRFLDLFPEALDLMIRAVQAGVPVVQAIQMAGQELPQPLGGEFNRMGNALRLGLDPEDVLNAAAERIDIPDFRFFVICIQLQRETGGALTETLENLAGIIRSRRDTRLKTRALTAEGRASSQAISAVPFVLLGAMQMTGSDYLNILYETPSGHTLLWIGGGLVLAGLVVINTMMRLEA